MKNILIISLLLTCRISFGQNIIDLNSLPPVQDYLVELTNPSADTVIIYLQGGPYPDLDTTELSFFKTIPTFLVVHLKQYQHLHPQIIYDSSLTLAEADRVNDTTVAMLQKAVLHYNALGKTVVITGHSYGALLVTEYIDDYGLSDVYRAISLSGRLNMNDTVVNAYANAYHPAFLSDGITVEIDDYQSPDYVWSLFKLAASIIANRYIDSLSGLDLTSYMFVYGTNDQQTGRLLLPEITALEDGNARVLKITGGDHFSPFLATNMNQVLNFIRTDATVATIESKQDAELQLFPNPFSNQLILKSSSDYSNTFFLYDFLGQQIIQQTFTNLVTINTEPLANGIYFYELRNDKGLAQNGKLIKK